MRRTIPILAGLALAAGCATAPAMAAFEDVDTDQNEQLSAAELQQYFEDEGVYDRYDADADEALAPMEFRNAVAPPIGGDAYFRGFDRDHDRRLTMTEFAGGLFVTYDENDDGWLSEAEFERIVAVVRVDPAT